MNTQHNSAKRRILSLTGLKGIACLIVMLNHFAGVFFTQGQRPWEQYPLITLLFNGTFMLYVFYAVSGFFVAYSIYHANRQKDNLAEKLFYRYFRLAIPVLVICAAIFVLQRLNLFAAYDQVKYITDSVRSENDAMNYYCKWGVGAVIKTALIAPIKTTTQFTFVLWMLHYIYKGFFVAVILSLITKPMKPLPAACTLLAGCFVLYVLGEYPLMTFAAGVLLANLYMQLDIWEPLRTLLGIVCITGALVAGTHWPNTDANNIFTKAIMHYLPNYVPMFVAGGIALVAGVLLLDILDKLLSRKPFVFLGNISLGVYLIHDMLQIAIGTNVFMLFYHLSGNIVLSRFAAFVSSTAAVIVGAYLIWKYLDPMISRILSKVWDAITDKK